MLSTQTTQKIEQLAASLSLYVYDIDFLKEDERHILRISITKKAPMQNLSSKDSNAVSLQDCQALSELLSPLLDVENINMDSYHLEVSSPGLERILKKPQHYAFSLGEILNIKLIDKSTLQGILHNVNDTHITLLVEKDEIVIPLESIKKAKVIFEF